MLNNGRKFTRPELDFTALMLDQANVTPKNNQLFQALSQSEAGFRLIFEAAQDPIFIKDRELKYIQVNPAMEQLVGLPAAKIIGLTAGDVLQAKSPADFTEADHRVLNGEIVEEEITYQLKQGSTVFQVVKFPICNTSGEIIGLCGIARDITKHKRMEEMLQKAQAELERRVEERTAELLEANAKLKEQIAERKRAEEIQRESEEKYRALIEQSDDAIFLIYGNKFELINPKFEELFGVTLADVNAPGFVFTNIVAHKNQMQVIERARKGNVGTKLSPRYEFTALDRNGNEIEVELSVSYPTYRGGLATQGVLRDITERKRAERILAEERALLAQRVEERTAELSAANAELARAARLKDEFVASVSHELRTPLNGVLGISELLREEIYGPLNEKQLKALKSIEESGRHLLSLINDILDLSKIEAGKLELQFETVSVEEVCRASLRMIKQIAYKKQLNVTLNLDYSVAVLQADGRRLKQILVNLLSNAVKFTPEGGSVGLEVAGNAEQGVVHFTVWDTGIGICQEDMGQLFQSFVQIDSSLSREHPGTGLGLSLVRRLTEMHGGGVSVESQVGQGSRFTVSLPWQPLSDTLEGALQRKSSTEKTDQLPRGEPYLILLVEDNETNIVTFFDFLQARGYRVIVARNGNEAIERAQEERPDLVLMDIQLPGMNGLEATRRLRSNGNLAMIPIIALTALAMPGDRERCLAAGADDYLSKPVSLKELIKVIEDHLLR